MAGDPPAVVVVAANTSDPRKRKMISQKVFSMAETLRWTVVDYDDIRSSLPEPQSRNLDEKLDEVTFHVLRKIAATQLSFGRGIFLLSPINHEYQAHLESLLDLADNSSSQVLIVECRGEDESELKNYIPNDIPHLILLLQHLPSLASPDDLWSFFQQCIPYFNDMRASFERNDMSRIVHGSSDGKSEFRHFTHHHPLKLEESREQSSDKLGLCSICVAPISDLCFSCFDCESFSLHKTCAELPQSMKLECHIHPITLANLSWETSSQKNSRLFRYSPTEYSESLIECAICTRGIIEEHKPVYGCLQCYSFFLHHECAVSTKPIINFNCHEHAMKLSSTNKPRTSYMFWCYACGNKGSKVSYHCMECDFHFHVHCAMNLPPCAERKCPHGQPLKLTSHPPKDDTNEYYCEICTERRHPDYWMYYCEKCEYEAHPHCVVPQIPSYVYLESEEGGDGSKVDEVFEEEDDEDF